ncbi:sacsin N-terminal ATP-binding-like domain-containing protein [Mycolicibacterium arseniciresistens]|uniref:DEAD/DEAH box helicase family protein n=1 Tax=Mycolicibacterium arseniciresistens TaxID=3062257 RepID=A0ABT8UCB4_9MYCO|nr:DEAD/DEAH box helicase family protein [Mycolicibacterium arseniciresistens]MDO3634455.1 DEAD/DEAH box helicase family protein [Mycolicibacterium arseniciresistens]
MVDSNNRSLQSYSAKPEWLEEHAHIEEGIAEGGYGHRQVYELVQNGADAMVHRAGGRIEVVLTDTHLYCANEGDPIDQSGLEALLGSNMSRKRGDEIGRFGLGFKSVLAVTNEPEFFSRPVSLRFSESYSRDQIGRGMSNADKLPLPILRLGEPLDAAAEAERDVELARLMTWAITVVRLKRDVDRDTSWLADDLAGFPAQFLLFTRHVSELILDDRVAGKKRSIHVQRGGEEVRLVEGDDDQVWRVFRKVVEPTPEARKDAGARAERDRLPIDWAVPTSGPSVIGKFWAFFPTTFETTLSGILNAPWKTNPDRENLLVGPFNEYLLDVAAELVVDNLHNVSSAADPGKHIDRMPARGREARGWADRRITERVYELAARRESLPDQRGHLALPSSLRLHPERVPADALAEWCSFDFRPHRWVHASADTRERRPRVERLLEAALNADGEQTPPVATYTEWLEALVSTGTAEASAGALRVAEMLKSQISPFDFEEVKAARIVLTASGELVAPDRNRLFIGGQPDISDTAQVDERLVDGSFAERVLRETFGIADVDRSAELAAYIATRSDDPQFWPTVWTRITDMPADQAKAVLLRTYLPGDVHVRTLAGDFQPLNAVLLAGPIVDAGGADPEYTLDEQWHSSALELLRELGATDLPRPDRSDFDSGPTGWYASYLDFVRDRMRATGAIVRVDTELVSDHTAIPSHIELLPHLNEDARARLTSEILRLHPDQHFWAWRQLAGRAESVMAPAPAVWLAKEAGVITTTQGLQPVWAAVAATLSRFERILPVSRLSAESTKALSLPDEIADCRPQILQKGLELLSAETDDDVIGRFSSAVASILPAPSTLRCRVGAMHDNRPVGEITPIANPDLYQQLRNIDTPIVLVSTQADADQLVDRWHLRREGDLITTEINFQLCAPEVPLIEEFPALRVLPAMAAHRAVTLLRCSELSRTVRAAAGQTSQTIDRAASDTHIYWLAKDPADPTNDDPELLRWATSQFGVALSDQQIAALLQNKKDEAQRKLVESIREQPDHVSRILACIGGERLRRFVPASLIDAVEEQGRPADDRTVAEMALAVHGVDILREAKDVLELRGLDPPIQWAGGRAAQEFVRNLGFPREYAGFPEERLEQVHEAYGPIDLKPLHDFQFTVSQRFRDVLRSREKTKRAMLSLPTGAGKTRVAVQSLVEHFRDGEIDGPVLWIAQSEELCEQAVQAWAEVWRAIGPPKKLTIGRLWDANSAEPVVGQPHVVVATIQKLATSVIEQERYEWLSQAAVVVIDEAHRGATTPTTTKLLRWLGLEARGDDRCPLVGLTATPFIGANEELTKILASRYGRERLDTGLFPEDDTEQLISLLQERRILARAEHARIDGVDIDLNADQMAELENFQRLPRSVEAELGMNAARNSGLVDHIKAQPDDWQILVFAASVENAQTLAALLALEGISAAAITAETRSGVRRLYVQKFKDREVRVLTNYGTLTTGFDAPEVRAVYVGRPTYSPNLYLQMIGRGLRGPANGGTEECLIVDVEDNVRMYGGKLAFTDFEFLWNEQTSA